jgi:hypothetical protein
VLPNTFWCFLHEQLATYVRPPVQACEHRSLLLSVNTLYDICALHVGLFSRLSLCWCDLLLWLLHFFLSISMLRASGIVLVIATSPQCLSPFPILYCFTLSRRPQMELPQNATPSACSSLAFRGLKQHLPSPCAVCNLADIPGSVPFIASPPAVAVHHPQTAPLPFSSAL